MEYIDERLSEINNIDIPTSSETIHFILKDIVNKKYSLEEIDEKCNRLPIYAIIHYLLAYGGEYDSDILNVVRRYYNNLRIDDNRCLVISDTHIGRTSEKDDPRYMYRTNDAGLYYAYKYAIDNNIKNVIHLGDLIEGNSDLGRARLNTVNEQVEYFKQIYPKDNDIKTYLLFGNHDYNAIMHDRLDPNFYKACPNIKLIGANYSYLYFCNYPIKLMHPCGNIFYKNIDLPRNFEMAGHSHNTLAVYDYNRHVSVPALAGTDINDVGFVELVNEENEFVFKYMDEYANYKREMILRK